MDSMVKEYNEKVMEHKEEVRDLVLAGLEQIKQGKTRDFNTVCDRLEKKYRDETVSG